MSDRLLQPWVDKTAVLKKYQTVSLQRVLLISSRRCRPEALGDIRECAEGSLHQFVTNGQSTKITCSYHQVYSTTEKYQVIMGSALSKQEWRPFDLDSESPYDLRNYIGRIAHFYTILDPRTLLIDSQQLQASKDALARFQANPSIVNDHATNRMLWRSKLNLMAVLHPDTKDPIFWAFRFSAFPVINIPVSTQ